MGLVNFLSALAPSAPPRLRYWRIGTNIIAPRNTRKSKHAPESAADAERVMFLCLTQRNVKSRFHNVLSDFGV